ncbi:MAG: chromosomal replication initiator protein DnaA [Desulfovibrio sp.]|jgi:chromosomal replication initiator protein|nr:chromosomal replication initiator protein DnaA [Desulfovibrio sp.]
MQKKWTEIQRILEKHLTPGQYKVWIAPLAPAWEDKKLILYASGHFVADFIQGRLLPLIDKAAKQIMGEDCLVQVSCRQAEPQSPHETKNAYDPLCAHGPAAPQRSFPDTSGEGSAFSSSLPASPLSRCREHADGNRQPSPPAPRPLSAAQLSLPLHVSEIKACFASEYVWRFSFDDFVVGSCNELAHAAARNICNSAYGPNLLFLSSAPGLGKTHLLQAVGKNLCESCNRATPKVEYLTAEEFASRFYFSLKTQDTNSFKARYRDIDLLLLEDVHFLQGKEKMQAELLATIKSVRARGGKVVFTSSFSPKDLRQMDEQLQSRFCAGLLSFIDRPDEQTRRRILRHKASIHQIILPDDVEDLLAKYVHVDVRQIESCLHNLILKSRVCNSIITAQMAREVIANYVGLSPALDMESIVGYVCRGFGLSRDQLVSISRKQEYVTARNTVFYLARKHTDLSLAAIGQFFNRKHSTVIKGITSLEQEMSRESPLGRQISSTVAMIERNSLHISSVQ